ncbi:MAG TPA: hypothetical protein PKW26_07245 [Treponemataceae bacterium]|nr:hypothetical protein [Treponemataceae bacterium]HOQ93398.1 hypothetical protein [Treponemataceae bacterium]
MRKFLTKISFCIILFFIFAIPLFSSSIKYEMEHEISGKTGTVSGIIIDLFNPFCSFTDTMYLKLFDANYFSTFAGFHFIQGAASFTLSPTWYFFKSNYFDAGVLFLYHFNAFYNLAIDQDFFYGLSFRAGTPNLVECLVDVSFMQKYTTIHSIAKSVPFFLNNGMAFKLKVKKQFTEKLTTSISLASYDEFYYPLFLFPIYALCFQYRLNEEWKLSTELALCYTDQFTLTSHMNTAVFKLGVSYMISKEQ